MANSKFEIKVLGDDLITKNSNGIVWNNIGYRYKQLGKLSAETGGLYDPKIFGQRGVCDCGKVKQPGQTCDFCGTYVYSDSINRNQYGVYILPNHIVNKIVLKYFITSLTEFIPTYFYKATNELSGIKYIWNTRIIPIEVDNINKDSDGVYVVRKLDNKLCKLDIKQFSESDPPSYYGYYGFEGFYNLFNSYKPLNGTFDEIIKDITQLMVIAPVSMRPISVNPNGRINYPTMTGMYSGIISISKQLVSVIKGETSSLADKLAASYAINVLVDMGLDEYSIIKPSKESLIRNALSTRLTKSGRANIISTDVPINTVKLPRALAYEALKTDIIEELRKRYPYNNAVQMYDNPSTYPEALEVFKEIAEDSVVVINRQPSLHKYSALAFHVKLWDENDMIGAKDAAVIGLNVQICAPFNADFDGDQMQFWFATKEPMKSKIYEKMCVEHNWIYDKNDKPVFTFNKGLIAGLYYATILTTPNDANNIKSYESIDDLFADYKYDMISHNERVKLEGVETSYGREKVKQILGISIDEILDQPPGTNIPIDGSNVDKLMYKLNDFKDKVEIVNNLYTFAKEVVTIEGLSAAPSTELYKISANYPEIDEIINDPERSDEEKWAEAEAILPELVQKKIKASKELSEYIASGSKIKPASLTSMLGPQIELINGKIVKHDESLITGLSQDAFIHHTSSNREILKQKANLVPQGGYLTSQLKNLCTNIILKGSDKKSSDTTGIITRKRYAVGRTDLNGNIIPANKDNGLIRVKSTLTSEDKTGFVVCQDEISKRFWNTYNQDGSMIGVAFVTGFTEALTQSALALKHGGSVFKPNLSGLYSKDYDGQVKELLSDRIILELGNQIRTYPVPKNAIFSKNTNNKVVIKSEGKGENGSNPIYLLNKPLYVDYTIAYTLKFLGAQSASGRDVNLDKTVVEEKDVYSLEDGIVHYNFDNRTVTTGNFTYPLYDDEAYYRYEGEHVKLGDRLCSGICNAFNYSNKIGKPEVFYLTIRQLEDMDYGIVGTEALEFILKLKYHTSSKSIVAATKKLDYISAAMGGDTKRILSENVGTVLEDSLMLRLILDRGNLTGLGD